MSTMKSIYLFLLFITCSLITIAKVDVSFESGVPSQWSTSNGELKTSNYHYKDGIKSLEWNWSAGEKITITELQNQGLVRGEVSSYNENTFYMWVYNPIVNNTDSVIISFLDQNNEVQYYYYFYLNYRGWRPISISYSKEMFGKKTSQNLQNMIIEAPKNGSGVFFIDRIDFTGDKIVRSAPSTHLPYKPNWDKNHWSDMYRYTLLSRNYNNETPNLQDIYDLENLKAKVKNYLKGNAPNSSNMNAAIAVFNKLAITENPDGTLKGFPLFGKEWGDNNNIGFIDDIILHFARDFVHNSNQSSRDKFIKIVRHVHDQGYHDGCIMETMHHVGYTFRPYPLAILLMENELKKEGLWDEAYKMVCWFVALDGIWEPTAETSNMDAGNTRTIARYCSIFFKDTESEQIQYLKGFRDYIQNWSNPKPQQGEGIKTDYTGFHHNFYYPSRYVTPAYKAMSWAVNQLSGSSFDVNKETKEVLKKCLLVNRLSTNSKDYPMSLAGRGNPFTNFNSGADALKYLALAYDPIDKQLAELINRVEPSSAISGFGKEAYPNGFWQLNYGTMGIYRASDWVANIKGFNNYFLGQEIYSGTSQYSRYAAYGALEILYSGGNSASGKNINGWDWNIIPGTTTIHLPLSKLNANGRRDERTDSKFAGSLRFGSKENYYLENETTIEGEGGIFAMDFQQKNISTNHNPSFRFQKSVFCIDGLMICLGSGISNNDTEYRTATNLFQNYIKSTTTRLIVNNESFSAYPLTKEMDLSNGNHWLIDAVGTGYLVKKGKGIIRLSKKNQNSRNDSNKSDTNGKFATAYIDHGFAPTGATYDFLVLPNANASEMRSLTENTNKTYKVLENNSNVHAISYQNIEAYAMYNINKDLKNTIISANSASCLAVVKNIDGELHCTISKPLIVFGDDGLAIKETIQLSFNGYYEIKGGKGIQLNSSSSDGTIIDIEVSNAEPNDFILSPAKRSSITLPVIHDAYFYNNKAYNNSTLRLVSNERDGYLLFDLSTISDSIVSASLNLQYSGNDLDASVVLALGEGTFWEETNLSETNKPKFIEGLDTLTTRFSSTTISKWNISSLKLEGLEKLSLILLAQQDESVNFASKETKLTDAIIPTLSLLTTPFVEKETKVQLAQTSNFEIFPNPFSTELHIKTKLSGQVELYNLQGQIVYSSHISKAQKQQLSFKENLNAGVYILKFHNQTIDITKRVVKVL